MEKLTLCIKLYVCEDPMATFQREILFLMWRPWSLIKVNNNSALAQRKSSSWNTHINGGASAQLGLDLIEAPWLWGLSVVPPFMEVLGVTQGSSQKLRIFWPDQEASASVIGGTRRWGGESRTLEDPANFWQPSFLCSQFESWGYLHFHHFHFFMQL